MQTLHSIITDTHHSAADTDAAESIRQRLTLVSDQWNDVWHRLSRQQEAVNMTVGLWRKYRVQLTGLHSRLTQIGKVLHANRVSEVPSVSIQRAHIVRLKVNRIYAVSRITDDIIQPHVKFSLPKTWPDSILAQLFGKSHFLDMQNCANLGFLFSVRPSSIRLTHSCFRHIV